MTIKYQLARALRKKDYESVHPCMYYMQGCHMVKFKEGDYIPYDNVQIQRMWGKFIHGVCPTHKESILEQIAKQKTGE